MGSNGVVSTRVEALGVSITIVDGSIAIEQTGLPTAPKVETANTEAIPVPPHAEQTLSRAGEKEAQAADVAKLQPPEEDERIIANAINPDRPPPNGSAELDETQSTKIGWTDDEIEQLKALYPTHSASVIARQMGRRLNAVKSKAQHLGLKKEGPPTVTAPRGPAPKPRSLSAAVTAESAPAPAGFGTVALLDHHSGQCRWIVSDTWPVLYCGEPVVDFSSWCERHSRRVFTPMASGPPGRLAFAAAVQRKPNRRSRSA
jgi:hypothetical protein